MLKIIYRICFATKYYFFFEIQPRRLFNFSWILYYFIFTLARCWRFIYMSITELKVWNQTREMSSSLPLIKDAVIKFWIVKSAQVYYGGIFAAVWLSRGSFLRFAIPLMGIFWSTGVMLITCQVFVFSSVYVLVLIVISQCGSRYL